MAYYVYLSKDILLPVTPGKIEMEINNKNKTYTLIDNGEINIPKPAGLTEVSFDALLPNVKYPFAVYKDGEYHKASWYLKKLEKLKTGKKKFQFIVSRKTPEWETWKSKITGKKQEITRVEHGGKVLYCTNLTCTLEEYTVREDAEEDSMDVTVSIKLKQYRSYGTKTVKVKKDTKKNSKKKKAQTKKNRPTNKDTSKAQKYTVVKGDCLWAISRKFYGQANWDTVNKIANANKDKISDPNLIYPGQVLTIPAL